jgi:GNAT superfamily N-acetyltransferase
VPVTVRRIRPDESDLLKRLRLASLSDAPEAFGERLSHAAELPDADWQAMARAASSGNRRAWFVAETSEPSVSGREAVGLVTARRRPPETCLLFSMWVDPTARGRGVGRALLDAVEEWAAGWGAREIVLWVFESNTGAIRLYEKSGFQHLSSGPDAEAGMGWEARAMRRRIDAARTGTRPRSGSAKRSG